MGKTIGQIRIGKTGKSLRTQSSKNRFGPNSRITIPPPRLPKMPRIEAPQKTHSITRQQGQKLLALRASTTEEDRTQLHVNRVRNSLHYGRQPQTIKGGCWAAAVALVGLALGGLAAAAPKAQTANDIPPLAGTMQLPVHAVTLDATVAACHVDFLPNAVTGDTPPKLRMTADMLGGRLSIRLSGGSFSEQVFLWSGPPQDFRPVVDVPADRLTEAPLWADLGAAAEQGATLYFTVRDGLGDYSSARYDALLPALIARTVSLACDVEVPGAVPATEIEGLRAERRLALSEADIAHIRRVLVSRFGAQGVQAGREPDFTITDRRLIGLYNGTDAGPGPEYLTAAAVAALLAEQPRIPAAPPLPDGADIVAQHRDWTVYSEAGGAVCSIMSAAQSATGYGGGVRPVMRFAVDRSGTGGLMEFELTRPNPFMPGVVVATIDGQQVDLFVEPSTGALTPRPLVDGLLSNAFTILLRQGEAVMIEGVAADTGSTLVLGYSAFGFTAAFREMSQRCNRPGILGWIE